MTPAPERPANGDEGACAGVDQAHPQQARDEGGLLPCPFCSEPGVKREAMGEFWCACEHCDASTTMRGGPKSAAKDWNRRTPLHNEAEQGLRDGDIVVRRRHGKWMADVVGDSAHSGGWSGPVDAVRGVKKQADAILQAISQHPVRGKP